MKKENKEKLIKFTSWLLGIGCAASLACLFSVNTKDKYYHDNEYDCEDSDKNNQIYKNVVRVSSDNIDKLDFDAIKKDKCPVFVKVSYSLYEDENVVNVIDTLREKEIDINGLYFETSVLEDLDYVVRNDVSYVEWKDILDNEYSFAKEYSSNLGSYNLYLDLTGSEYPVIKEISGRIPYDKILSSTNLPHMSSVNENEDSYIIEPITRKR